MIFAYDFASYAVDWKGDFLKHHSQYRPPTALRLFRQTRFPLASPSVDPLLLFLFFCFYSDIRIIKLVFFNNLFLFFL